jgi:hypothetical protein
MLKKIICALSLFPLAVIWSGCGGADTPPKTPSEEASDSAKQSAADAEKATDSAENSADRAENSADAAKKNAAEADAAADKAEKPKK